MTRQKAETLPVYFLYGPEDFLIEEEIERLLRQTLSPKERGFNFHVFSGEENSGREILQTAQTLPMFSSYRFVLVREADHFDGENIEILLPYLRDPSPTTCLVLRGQTLGPWKKYQKELEKKGKVIEYPRLRGKNLLSWVRRRMEEKGKMLSEEAANYLIEVLGDHLQDLDNGLEKIYLAAGSRKAIELSDVEGIPSELKVSTIFDLTEAIGQQNIKKAFLILQRALESKSIPFKKDEPFPQRKDDPLPLLVDMMSKHYWNIWRAKEIAASRKSLEEMAQVLRMQIWNVKKLVEQGRNFSIDSLQEGILKCHQTDLALKKGKGPKNLLVEKLVIDLCHPKTKRASLP